MNNTISYYTETRHFTILGLMISTAIGVASSVFAGVPLVIGGAISMINQIVTSQILNPLIAQGITDAITLGIIVGSTFLGYQTVKWK